MQPQRTQPPPDRLAPHDLPSEKGVLGCLLIAPESSWEIVDTLKLVPEYWYDMRHRVIFGTLLLMRENREAIDLINLQAKLKSIGKLTEIGGLAYLNELEDSVPSAANCSAYLDTVRDKYLLRLSLQVCTDHVNQVHKSETGTEDRLLELERKVFAIRESSEKGRGIADIEQVMLRIQARVDAAQGGSPTTGILTGFPVLDAKLRGLRPQQLVYLAGTPGSGKTTLALNISLNHIFTNNGTVGIFSFETAVDELVDSMIACRAQLDSSRINDGEADLIEYEAFGSAGGELVLRRKQLLICDDGGMDMRQVMAKARWMKNQGASLFVIDYLQLVDAKGADERERTELKSKACKLMAKELDSPVIVVTALTNEVLKEGKRPTLGNLKNSGQMSYDGDKVLILYCEEPANKTPKVEVNIEKNKRGKKGRVWLTMYPSQYRFGPYVRDTEDE